MAFSALPRTQSEWVPAWPFPRFFSEAVCAFSGAVEDFPTGLGTGLGSKILGPERHGRQFEFTIEFPAVHSLSRHCAFLSAPVRHHSSSAKQQTAADPRGLPPFVPALCQCARFFSFPLPRRYPSAGTRALPLPLVSVLQRTARLPLPREFPRGFP